MHKKSQVYEYEPNVGLNKPANHLGLMIEKIKKIVKSDNTNQRTLNQGVKLRIVKLNYGS